MRRIAAYYKGMQVPGLSRVKVWSDGDPTTYKGRKQFGRTFPLDEKLPTDI